jgi:hypothetical protein
MEAFCRIHPPLLWSDLREPSMSGGQDAIDTTADVSVSERTSDPLENRRSGWCPKVVAELISAHSCRGFTVADVMGSRVRVILARMGGIPVCRRGC